MKQFNRALGWAICTGGYWFAAWAGIHGHNAGALNLFKFLAWFLFICTMLAQFSSLEKKQKCFANHPVPAAFRLGTDIAGMLFLAWNGFFLYAALTFIQAMGEQGLDSAANSKTEGSK